jgi:hypothetical protein
MNFYDLNPFDAGAQIDPCVELPYCLAEHEPDCHCDQRHDFERRREEDPQTPLCECPECTCPCKIGEPDPPIGFVRGPGGPWVAVLASNDGGHTHMVGDPPEHVRAHFREVIAQWEADFNAAHPLSDAYNRP